jgi:hypothetical protein
MCHCFKQIYPPPRGKTFRKAAHLTLVEIISRDSLPSHRLEVVI